MRYLSILAIIAIRPALAVPLVDPISPAGSVVSAGEDILARVAVPDLKVRDSSILTNSLNGNTIAARNDVVLPDNINAIFLAFINAAVAAGADMQAAVANIDINYNTLLSNIGNNNVVRSLPETADIASLVEDVSDAGASVGVDINTLIGNINIETSDILTDILNGNNVVVLK